MIDFERIIQIFFPKKKINYAVFWLILGTVLLLIQELVIFLARESENQLWSRAIVIYVLFSGIVTAIWLSRAPRNTLTSFSTFLIMPGEDKEKWIETNIAHMFSFRTIDKVAFIIIFIGVGVIIFVKDLTPFFSCSASLVWYLEWSVALAFTGYASHGILFGIHLLGRIVGDYRLSIPFYRINHPAIQSLTNFYLVKFSLVQLIFYIFILIAVGTSPYGFSYQTIVWSAGLAFFPLATFVWSFGQIHKLLQRVKQDYIDQINNQVQKSLTLVNKVFSKENVGALSDLLDLQKKVERIHEWPFAVEGVLTFLITLLLPIAQIVAIAFQIIQPRTP